MKLTQSLVLANTQGDLITEGLVTLVVGMSVVFLALLVLVVILEASGKFFTNLQGKEKVAKNIAPVAPAVIETPITEQSDDTELIAVITAVIAASMGTSTDNLQVRSLRKTGSAWSKTGRINQLYN